MMTTKFTKVDSDLIIFFDFVYIYLFCIPKILSDSNLNISVYNL